MSAVAVAQVLLLGGALGFLILRLREVRADLIRAGREEQSFLDRLADAESELYRSSILLRDEIILTGPEQRRAREELADLLERISTRALRGPDWIPPEMRDRLATVESDRREYLARARTVSDWNETERRVLGPNYLAQQLTPMRERFVATAREIATLVQALRESRNRSMADSIAGIQSLVVRIVFTAAGLGLALAAAAVWRFRHYESELHEHIRHLGDAQGGLRALSQRLVESQEGERKSLSRELHDEVGQILTALRVRLGQIEPAGGSSVEHLRTASELAERSLQTVRHMARGLRPAMLDDLGLASALNWLGRDFSKNTVLDVRMRIQGDLSELDEARRTCLYRVVQESLTNCVKHSGSTTAAVLVHESPEQIVLTVQDNGSGFKPGASKGIGLLGMRERVEELHGEFAVISSPGAGTVVRVNLPKGGTAGA